MKILTINLNKKFLYIHFNHFNDSKIFKNTMAFVLL